MKSKISPTAIGVFIAGAIVILFGSVLLFGSGKLFKDTKAYLLTFDEPVNGLDVGAPVKLLGVNIGAVKQVDVAVGKGTNTTLMANVLIEVDRKRMRNVFGKDVLHLDDRALFDKAVNVDGLRGRLDVLSLLSGQLYVALDMYPGKPGFRLNEEQDRGYWEIPTLPSEKRELVRSLLTSLENLSQTDVAGAVKDLKGLVSDLRRDLDSLRLEQTGSNLVDTLAEAKALVGNPQLKEAITNLNSALVQIDTLGRNINPRINPLLEQASADLQRAGTLFENASRTLDQLGAQVQPDSALIRELVRTLDEAGSSLRALRELAEQIERNPSSLITGKKESTPQP